MTPVARSSIERNAGVAAKLCTDRLISILPAPSPTAELPIWASPQPSSSADGTGHPFNQPGGLPGVFSVIQAELETVVSSGAAVGQQ